MYIRNRGDGALAAIFFLGSIFLFCETWQIREIFSYSFGPRVFPRIILGGMALFSACLFVQSLGAGPSPDHALNSAEGRPVNRTPNQAATQSRNRREAERTCRETLRLRAGMIILLLAYIIALPHAGYAAATMPFLFASMVFLGRRGIKEVLLYAALSVGMTVLLKFIFGRC